MVVPLSTSMRINLLRPNWLLFISKIIPLGAGNGSTVCATTGYLAQPISTLHPDCYEYLVFFVPSPLTSMQDWPCSVPYQLWCRNDSVCTEGFYLLHLKNHANCCAWTSCRIRFATTIAFFCVTSLFRRHRLRKKKNCDEKKMYLFVLLICLP